MILQMIETNFVERGALEVDKDLAKNKWRWDWLEAQVCISYFASLFFLYKEDGRKESTDT